MSDRVSIIRSKVISLALGLMFSDVEDREDQILRRGSVPSLESVAVFVPSEFIEVKEWSYGYFRRVWISSGDLAVITYCEGDVCISTFDTYFAFDVSLQKAKVFYERVAA